MTRKFSVRIISALNCALEVKEGRTARKSKNAAWVKLRLRAVKDEAMKWKDELIVVNIAIVKSESFER